MIELRSTGWMSNRGRQNVASFLTKDLAVDWRVGAELFEMLLIDHDVAANYGNWQYFSGVGNDPKNRHFRTVSQGMTYDPQAEFVQMWIPSLKALEPEIAHAPWTLADGEDARGTSGSLYLEPLVNVATQTKYVPPQIH